MKYCTNLKPALLRLLEQRFAEVDNGKSGGSARHGSKKAGAALPEVRGARRGKPPHNTKSSGSSRQSSSGSVGSRGKPLAPLEMSPGGRFGNRMDSRDGHAILEDKLMPQTDIFAPVYNDVLRSPCNDSLRSPPVTGSPIASPEPHFGMVVDAVGHDTVSHSASLNALAVPRHQDPNYIPSPQASPTPKSDPFSVDDEAFMDEIEGL